MKISLVILGIIAVLMGITSCTQKIDSLSIDAMDNLIKKGLTIQDGAIMTSEDAREHRKEKSKHTIQFLYYADKYFPISEDSKPAKTMSDFLKKKEALIKEIDSDTKLLPKARERVMELLEIEERTLKLFLS